MRGAPFTKCARRLWSLCLVRSKTVVIFDASVSVDWKTSRRSGSSSAWRTTFLSYFELDAEFRRSRLEIDAGNRRTPMKPDLSRNFQPDLFQSASNSTLSLQECNPDEIIRGKNSEFWELRPVLFPTGS